MLQRLCQALMLCGGGGLSSLLLAADDSANLQARALFDWAEYAYPQLFTPANPATQVLQGYQVRHYSGTDTFLGVKDGIVYGHGTVFASFPDSGGGIRRLGTLADFRAGMTVDGFALTEGEGLVVSEVMAKSSDGSADWVEFANAGTVSVALKQYQVRDGGDDHAAQTLPNVTLAPGDFLVIPTSADTTLSGPYQLGFNLGKNDRMQLLKDGVVIDDLDWDAGEAAKGYSFGRFPGPRSQGRTLLPSRAARNVAAQRGPLVINEIMASPVTGQDWFELYNAGTTPLSLASYTIVDDDIKGVPTALPAQTLAAGAFVRFFAVGETGNVNATNFPFKLGDNDSLTLRQAGKIVDFLEWDTGDAPLGKSYGSLRDGSFATGTLTPTPATPNVRSTP